MNHFSIDLEPVSSALKVGAAYSFETPVSTYDIIHCQRLNDYILNDPCSENLET